MRRLTRLELDSSRASQQLSRWQSKVDGAAKPVAEAARLWRQAAGTETIAGVRKRLQRMATGRGRCMYCEDSLGTDIEHFHPKAQYPDRTFRWSNYLLACSHCNSNLKRDEFPLLSDGEPALIDPTTEDADPDRHLTFLPSSGELVAVGPKGGPSIEVFGLNDRTSPRKLPQARKAVLHKLQILLEDYDRAASSGAREHMAFIDEMIRDEPFPSVLPWLLRFAEDPTKHVLLRPGIPALVRKHASLW